MTTQTSIRPSIVIIPLEDLNKRESEIPEGNVLIFVTSGYLIRDHIRCPIRMNKHDLHVSLPEQASPIQEYSPDVKGYLCCFTELFSTSAFLSENIDQDLAYMNSFMYRFPLRVNPVVANRIEFIFQTLYSLLRRYEVSYPLIQTYLTTILLEMKQLMTENELNPYPSKAFLVTKQYNDLLSEFITRHRTMAFYALQLNITPNHLNKSVKAVTGKTAIQLLNEACIQKAKLFLSHTDKTIGDISFELGFEDNSCFSRFFKKATGLSPMQYRKRSKI